ncbi:ECF transporter S component [candidate division KSB1 bacterium]|nr:ECF transporter S component [candidate division KSB1 bacterium]
MKRTRLFTRLVILITLTLVFEMIGLPQPVTGPLVNLMLILTALLLNTGAGIILGTVTPLVALLRGQLPPILAPMAPFIILANAAYIFAFMHLSASSRRRHHRPGPRTWLALIAGAGIKTALLYGAARLILPFLIGRDLPEAAIAAMSLPQLFTALVGGGAALAIYPTLDRILNNEP